MIKDEHHKTLFSVTRTKPLFSVTDTSVSLYGVETFLSGFSKVFFSHGFYKRPSIKLGLTKFGQGLPSHKRETEVNFGSYSVPPSLDNTPKIFNEKQLGKKLQNILLNQIYLRTFVLICDSGDTYQEWSVVPAQLFR